MSEGLFEQIYITFLHSSSVQNKDHEWEEQMKKGALHEDGFEKKACFYTQCYFSPKPETKK